MNRKRTLNWNPAIVWTGVTVLFGIGIAYTPALGNGTTWSLPYSGSATLSNANVFSISNNGSGISVAGFNTVSSGFSIGVLGQSTSSSIGIGVWGEAFGTGGVGVSGFGSLYGMQGVASGNNSCAVYGNGQGTGASYGVLGAVSTGSNYGVSGQATNGGTGVLATSDTGNALYASTSNSKVAAFFSLASGGGPAIFADAASTGDGVDGFGAIGIHGMTNGQGANLAGRFDGNVTVTGNLQVNGTINKSAVGFKIDHPLDP